MVPPTTAVNKVAVRNYLRGIDKEDQWTEMQGYVYGKRMQEAHPYPGAIEFMSLAKQLGHHLLIISHKQNILFLVKSTTFIYLRKSGSKVIYG